MLNVLRFVLQCLIVLFLMITVVGVFAAETGAAEKVVLVALGALLIYAATFVRQLGVSPSN